MGLLACLNALQVGSCLFRIVDERRRFILLSDTNRADPTEENDAKNGRHAPTMPFRSDGEKWKSDQALLRLIVEVCDEVANRSYWAA